MRELCGKAAGRAGIPGFAWLTAEDKPPKEIALTRGEEKKSTQKEQKQHPPKAQKHQKKIKKTPPIFFRAYVRKKKPKFFVRAYARKKIIFIEEPTLFAAVR